MSLQKLARELDETARQSAAMVEGVKAMGMETCMTLGMLSDDDVGKLKGAGLDYYNHNIDTSERYYSKVITTRTFADRLQTLERVGMDVFYMAGDEYLKWRRETAASEKAAVERLGLQQK